MWYILSAWKHTKSNNQIKRTLAQSEAIEHITTPMTKQAPGNQTQERKALSLFSSVRNKRLTKLLL